MADNQEEIYYSQPPCYQDRFLAKNIFPNKQNGIFIDVGAYDGVDFSNTLHFEKFKNWSGILIEPLPDQFALLKRNRPKSIHVHAAVSLQDKSETSFVVAGMFSGIPEKLDPRHVDRFAHEFRFHKTITVPTRRLDSLLDEHQIQHVDLLCIDTEGSELDVLQSLGDKHTMVDVVLFEENYADKSVVVHQWLREHDFVPVQALGWDWLYKKRHLS